MNDLPKISNHIIYLLFADDTNLFVGGKDVIKLQQEVEIDMNRKSELLNTNKLTLNIKIFRGIQ